MREDVEAGHAEIAGYDYGTPLSAVSPVTEEELRALEETVGWTDTDAKLLRQYADIFSTQAESMVDSWRAVIAAQPHLAKWFFGPDGKPDETYKARVKLRFVQWVKDVAARPHDRDWLNYQQEIGLRHTPAKKNRTDDRQTPPLVPLRYLLGFLPVVLPIRRFFEATLQDEAKMKALESAWSRAVFLHVILWSRAYAAEGLW
jgi:hypothetical protein